ncbi:MAG: PASTA domain-containing protein [Armatimonadetes bacterium]|nr:PASTA domain-containing protein [Armatimonadota bacterium]
MKTPDLISLNLNDAKEEANKMGLELMIEGEDFGEDSQIIWQSPGAGEKLEKNIIKVKCIQTIVMPELIGKTKDEVLKLMEKSGLVLGEIEIVQTKEAKSEIILDQDPKAGIEIPKGSKVNLVISKGEF